MDTETENLINMLRDRIQKMTDKERTDLLDALFAGYCQRCGADIGDGKCYCTNDE